MAKQHKEHTLPYVLGLIVVCLFWGLGFPALKFCENIPTFVVMSFRFSVAAVLIALVFWKRLKHIDKELIKAGIWVGFLIFLCYLAATIGIKYTTSARCSFFSCLGAICVPFINWVGYKVKITKEFLLCIVICILGVYLISMGGGTEEIGLASGDLICLLASFFGACQLVELERKCVHLDIIALNVVQLATIAVLSIAGMLVFGEAIPSSLSTIEIGSLIFMAVCASAIAFLLQFICVKHVPSNRASLILTLEPVLGAVASIIILGDSLGWAGYLGGLLIMISIFVSENMASVKE